MGAMLMNEYSRIYVAGHRGLVGSAIWRELQRQGFDNLIGRTRQEVDLLDADAVKKFFAETKPEFVFIAAAKVGGIYANDTQPAAFLFENLQIQNNLIHAAWQAGVRKLLFLGSSCIYPKLAPQPLKEEYLLSGPLEPTNQWYAIAKIAGIKLCQACRRQHGCDFISAMPTNMYGPNDNYDLQTSHVLPALIRKFHEAKQTAAATVTCWGTGAPLREFLYADDLAGACVFLMQQLQRGTIHQRGLWQRPQHPGTGRIDKTRGRLCRRDCLGRVKTGRHPAQAHGQFAIVRPGLAAASGPGNRHPPHLRGLSCANNRAENNRGAAASTRDPALAGQVVLHHLHVGVHHQFDQVVELRLRFPLQLLFRF